MKDAELAQRLDEALKVPAEMQDILVELEHIRAGSLTTLRLAIMDAIREIRS